MSIESQVSIQSPDDLFRYDLARALSIEECLSPLLDQLAGEVDDRELEDLLHNCARRANQHVEKIQKCFELLRGRPERVTVHMVEGLKQDHDSFIHAEGGGWIVITPFAVELAETAAHCGIGVYTGLAREAESLNYRICQRLLQENLWDEEQMAQRVAAIGSRLLGVTHSVETGMDVYDSAGQKIGAVGDVYRTATPATAGCMARINRGTGRDDLYVPASLLRSATTGERATLDIDKDEAERRLAPTTVKEVVAGVLEAEWTDTSGTLWTSKEILTQWPDEKLGRRVIWCQDSSGRAELCALDKDGRVGPPILTIVPATGWEIAATRDS